MESVELKEKVKTKRIRRSFPRQEVYHRWIHSPEYCYTNKGQRYSVSGFEDWLIVGDFGKHYIENTTKENLINEWYGWRKSRCIAVINREKKQILISFKYQKQSIELLGSIPNDYEVFKTEEEIPKADILSTGGLSDVLHLHSNYLIEKFIEKECSPFYTLLTGKTRNCNTDYYEVFSISEENKYHNLYTKIIDFVKKYKLKKYDWYKETSNKRSSICVYKGWSKKWIKVKLPSLKQVVTKKILKPNEIDLVNKKAFYTKYCYGKGISYKTVEKKWNQPITKEEFEKLANSINHPMLWDNIEIKPATWNDGIKVIYKSIIGHIDIVNKRNKELSKQYYEEALAKVKEINESENSIKDWRDGKTRQTERVEYRHWLESYKTGVLGKWVTGSLSTRDTVFSNTQLRLSNDLRTIITSKFASVTVESAIYMWRLYKHITKQKVGIKGEPIMIRLEDKHYHVGIYNLRAILYSQKKTDDGKLLDNWEWCVVIGCHYIWIDDFIDFVKYYNLYTLFGIEEPKEKVEEKTKSNKPFKIKIK